MCAHCESLATTSLLLHWGRTAFLSFHSLFFLFYKNTSNPVCTIVFSQFQFGTVLCLVLFITLICFNSVICLLPPWPGLTCKKKKKKKSQSSECNFLPGASDWWQLIVFVKSGFWTIPPLIHKCMGTFRLIQEKSEFQLLRCAGVRWRGIK